ncbi:MAG: hypothetical protein WC208_08340 [Gallionella sp.]
MRIYLAGVEQHDSNDNLFKDEFTNVFASYYYLRSKGDQRIKEIKAHTKSIIVDSGAHSFFAETDNVNLAAGVHKKVKKTEISPDQYFEQYLAWLSRNRDYFEYFVELDIGELVGQEKVRHWRNVLKAEGLLPKCITVYHPAVVTYEEYLKELDESVSRYIAIEGDRRSRARLPYMELIKSAYDRKVKVHVFAMIKKNALGTYPIYSADSSSWKAGAQYGACLCFVKGELKSVRFNTDKKNVFKLAGQLGGVEKLFHETLAVQRELRYGLSIHAYKEMEDYYTELWTKRGIVWN